MPILESAVQRRVVDYARGQGALAIKLSTLGMRGTAGWPDYMFIWKQRILFVEFKAPGKSLTALQEKRHVQLREHGFQPITVNDSKVGIAYVRSYFGWWS